MPHTVSFAILDDLSPATHMFYEIDSLSRADITKAVRQISNKYRSDTSEELYDPTGTYFDDFEKHVHEVIIDLHEKGYSVWNRYEKYYVIAWAIDFTRFEVFSKDYDKKLIDWTLMGGKDDGVVKGLITNPNYNENPVITFLNSLHR